jgi:ribosomal protein L24
MEAEPGMVIKKSMEIPTGNIRILKSKKNRQHNGQKKKDKQTNNDLIIHRKQKIEQSEPH